MWPTAAYGRDTQYGDFPRTRRVRDGVIMDDSALLDSVEHRLKDCVKAKNAWAWASAVLVGAGIAYLGKAAGFWLYGGTLDTHSERVVSVLRGAFFEAIRPARQ